MKQLSCEKDTADFPGGTAGKKPANKGAVSSLPGPGRS